MSETEYQILHYLRDRELKGKPVRKQQELVNALHITKGRVSQVIKVLKTRDYIDENLTLLPMALAILGEQPEAIPIYGKIAAGTAIPFNNQSPTDYVTLPDFDPSKHFSFVVQGTSMEQFHIVPGDIVILEKPRDPFSIPNKKIIAALIPENTILVDTTNISEIIEHRQLNSEYGLEVPCDHITLKMFFQPSTRIGQDPITNEDVILVGTGWSLLPKAIEVAGILVAVYRRDLY